MILSRGVWMMLVASLAFGVMNISVKMTPELSAPEMVFFRSLVQIIIGYFTLLKLGVSPLGKNRKLLAMRGLFGSMGLLCYFYTLHQMPLGNAIIIHYLAPVLTTILAIWMAGEKVIPIQWLFFGFTFLGVVVVNGAGFQVPLIPLIAGFGGAFFSALAYNTIKKLKGVEDPNVVVLYFPMVSVPIALSYFLFRPGEWVWPHGMQWLWILITGVSTQIGQFFMTRAYQEDLASRVSAVSYAGILWGAGAGLLVFGETYNLVQYLGMAMVIAGVILNINAQKVKDFFAPGEE
ncbi:MAG: DMT family transporter [Bacteroidetes bacterium]|nr:DMT family transporter [Bacteroidota bacterium]